MNGVIQDPQDAPDQAAGTEEDQNMDEQGGGLNDVE